MSYAGLSGATKKEVRLDVGENRVSVPEYSNEMRSPTQSNTDVINESVKGVHECDNDMIKKWKSETDCSECPTNAVTQQPSAILQREKEKDLRYDTSRRTNRAYITGHQGKQKLRTETNILTCRG